MLNRFTVLIGSLNETIGKTVSWLVLIMAFVQLIIIGLLFIFNFGFLWLQESILYMNGTLFMLALGWTFKEGRHVRIDIFYNQQPIKKQAQINLSGNLLFLLPLSALMFWHSIFYAATSWSILEGSREVGGIPAIFLLKTIIPLSALLLGLQSIAESIMAAKTIWKK